MCMCVEVYEMCAKRVCASVCTFFFNGPVACCRLLKVEPRQSGLSSPGSHREPYASHLHATVANNNYNNNINTRVTEAGVAKNNGISGRICTLGQNLFTWSTEEFNI